VSQLGRRSLLGGFIVAAVVLVAPTPVTSVTPADPAVAVLAPPPINIEPSPELPAVNYAAAMVDAARSAIPRGVTFGMAVLDVRTGQLATTGTEQFYSASLSKLMLVVDMLDRDVELTPAVVSSVNRVLSLSDDDAMNSLWVRFDGHRAMTRVATSLGMVRTEASDDSSQWGEVQISPAGFTRLYQHILTEMTPEDQAVIMTGLNAAQPVADDGFNQFYGLLGQPYRAYAKQGWMFYGSRLYLHSAGVVTVGENTFAVSLMSVQTPSSGIARANLSTIAAAMQRGFPIQT
jgi:hypothetical protein